MWNWAERTACMVDDRRPGNCVNCKVNMLSTQLNLLFGIPVKTFSVSSLLFKDSVTIPKYLIVCSGSRTDYFKFITSLLTYQKKDYCVSRD